MDRYIIDHQPTIGKQTTDAKQMDYLIDKIQRAIIERPAVATGLTWTPCRIQRNGATVVWRTSQRPDGSATDRRDKMTFVIMPNGSVYLQYNGGSFQSCDLWSFLKNRYHEQDFVRLLRALCDDYGIPFDEPTRKMNTHTRKPSPKPTAAAKTIPTIGDESNVHTIPADLVAKTIDLHREDSLRAWLETWLDDLVLECAWHDYGVGITKDGHPIFWYYDRDGRVRDGKIMKYQTNGHRDRDADGSILAAGSLLRKAKILPADWQHDGCLYGEHLLRRYPDAIVGLVESEKTAIVAAVCFPHYIWLATGGATANLDRAAAVLNGRKVVCFPDADATGKWSETFDGLPGWSICRIAHEHAVLNGQDWQKCDLADILAQRYTHE